MHATEAPTAPRQPSLRHATALEVQIIPLGAVWPVRSTSSKGYSARFTAW